MTAIDTSVAIDFLRGEGSSVSKVESAQRLTDSIGISSMSLFEVLHPLYHRKLDTQERIVRSFVHQLRLLPWTRMQPRRQPKSWVPSSG